MSAATVAQQAALRYLLLEAPEPFHRDALMKYYRRNGPMGGLSTVARRGAAGRMFWRLFDAGYIEDAPGGGYRLTATGALAARGNGA